MTDTTICLVKGSLNNIARIIEFLVSVMMKCVMLVIQVILMIPMLLCSMIGLGLLAGFLAMMLLSVYYAFTLI